MAQVCMGSIKAEEIWRILVKAAIKRFYCTIFTSQGRPVVGQTVTSRVDNNVQVMML